MKFDQYRGEIWQGQAVHPELWGLLLQKDRLIELAFGQPPYAVVLGVPHHAAPGVERIAEKWINPRTNRPGRPADETAGLTGLAVFSALRQSGLPCKLVIAAHPTENDPNKTSHSTYWQQIFTEPYPALLFELHGAARRRHFALELSAGRNTVARPLDFGRRLASFVDDAWPLAVQLEPGTREGMLYHGQQWTSARLENPALETLSLAYAGQIGIPALHLEMKSLFRRPDSHQTDGIRPPEPALRLAQALVRVFLSL